MSAAARHHAATAEYAAASAEYEAAAMADDANALAAADRRLAEADREYCETLAAVVAVARRRSLPSFEDMLRHPWTQPGRTFPAGVVYGEAVQQSAGLPVRPGTGGRP